MKTILLILVASALVSCSGKSKSAGRLQAHLGQAQTASEETTSHIRDFKGTADAVDYKGNRAKKLWQEGVERPF